MPASPRRAKAASAPRTKRRAPAAKAAAARAPLAQRLRGALAELERASTAHDLANLDRFGIVASRPYGVSMASLKAIAKRCGRDHDLAGALWKSGRYEERMLATLVGDPERLTAAEMERWCRDFDNWAICDTACFALFDRSPHAWSKVGPWCERTAEFERRAGFALLACLALHDKRSPDAPFLAGLHLVERQADDDRNFVKKGVSWALRSIGRRNRALGVAATALARRLAGAPDAAARWIGKDASREFARLAGKRKGTAPDA